VENQRESPPFAARRMTAQLRTRNLKIHVVAPEEIAMQEVLDGASEE
jgi:hypothetical protein